MYLIAYTFSKKKLNTFLSLWEKTETVHTYFIVLPSDVCTKTLTLAIHCNLTTIVTGYPFSERQE